jgi:hypothetical protein
MSCRYIIWEVSIISDAIHGSSVANYSNIRAISMRLHYVIRLIFFNITLNKSLVGYSYENQYKSEVVIW